MSARKDTLAGRQLGAEFFERDVCDVAAGLIGCTIEHTGTSGRVVEAEAYHQSEPACHAFIGETKRNAALFGPAGHVYVYISYGIHYMLNFVTGPTGEGSAVLIRALEPLTGLDLMRGRRGVDSVGELCSGPGKLAQALGIGPGLNGVALASGPLRVAGADQIYEVASGPRVGITRATDLDWRYAMRGSPFVSRPRLNQ